MIENKYLNGEVSLYGTETRENNNSGMLFVPGFGEREPGVGGYGRFVQILSEKVGEPVVVLHPKYFGEVWPSDVKSIRKMLSDRVCNIHEFMKSELGMATTVMIGHSHGAMMISDAVMCIDSEDIRLLLLNPPFFSQGQLALNRRFLSEGIRKVTSGEWRGLWGYTNGLLEHLASGGRNALRAIPAIAEGIDVKSLPVRTSVMYARDDKIFPPDRIVRNLIQDGREIRSVVIPGGHTGILDFPEILASQVASELITL